MRRSIRFLASAAILGLAAACGDSPAAPESGISEFDAVAGLTAGVCTNLTQLNTLARSVFQTASPNVSSVLGKLKNLDKQVKKGSLTAAAAHAHDIVDFTLEHFRAGRLPGTEVQLSAFVNAVYCFAGIDMGLNEPANSHLIFPSDQPQIVYSIDSKAAIRFDANPVSEPTLIEYAQLPETYPPGGGPLDTKLDQYPGFLLITKSSATGAPLTRPAVVGVCASGVIPSEVRDRLSLGHGKSTGFEIADEGDASFLDCENAVEETADAGVLSRLARWVIPKALHARMQTQRGGGVGGTVTEFSPFAPVDPVLRSGGGVGGTVTEFIRSPMMSAGLLDGLVVPIESCDEIVAGVGMEVGAACRPFVRVTTRLGTSFQHVPVTWSVTLGGGKVAPQSAQECGVFASMIISATDLFGQSSVCWKLGAAGANQVTATPGIGGDAPEGVTFEPAVLTFDATANVIVGPPTQIISLQGNGQEGWAGHLAPITPKVRVMDAAGNPVAGVTVKWLVRDSGSVGAAESVTDAAGIAAAAWTLGLGTNTLKAYIDQHVFAYVYFAATGVAVP